MIDEKLLSNEVLTDEEIDFYNGNLGNIKVYYERNFEYWKTRALIPLNSES